MDETGSRETVRLRDFLASADERSLAGAAIREGGLVVMPTETVYGLAANALDSHAVASIYVAKGRPSDNPLIVHVSSVSDIDRLCGPDADALDTARALFARFSPGPLTLVLPRSKDIPLGVTAGLETVGIRIPSHPVALALIEAAGVPLAAPSANRSGRVSPTTFAMACAEMDGRVDAIIDGGDCQVGLESTVAKVGHGTVSILRPGAVTEEMLAEALPGFAIMKSADLHVDPSAAAPSPGMRYAHYRPSAEVYCWKGGPVEGFAHVEGLAVIGLASDIGRVDAPLRIGFSSVEEYAARFFAALAECDRAGARVILAQSVPESGIGSALMNRLVRAAAGRSVG